VGELVGGSFLQSGWEALAEAGEAEFLSAPFRNPWKVAGLKTTVLPCSWGRFLPD
jgi:hypothetical protein